MNQVVDKDICEIPCEGIYADINKESGEIVDENTPGMKEMIEAYDKYKNQFFDDIVYPISGTRTEC